METVVLLVILVKETTFLAFPHRAPTTGCQSENFLGIEDPKQADIQIARADLGRDYFCILLGGNSHYS